MMKKQYVWIMFTLLFLLAGCQPGKTELSFETIERRDWPGSGREWRSREPGLRVIATSENLAQVDVLFTEDAQAQLNQLDFDNYFAVIAFLGWHGNGHEGIEIERAVRQGENVSVYVQVGELRGTDEEASPYHLVKIRKEGNWDQIIHFLLYLYGEEVVRCPILFLDL